MPNIKSAIKRVRTTKKRTAINKSARSQVSTTRRRFKDAVAAGDKEKAVEAYRAFCSQLDRGVKKGIIKANTASRNKSRGSKAIEALEA